ncbi:MAG TPA: hypothetical protein VGJ21_01080, partial [Terracidiphilus sp.]
MIHPVRVARHTLWPSPLLTDPETLFYSLHSMFKQVSLCIFASLSFVTTLSATSYNCAFFWVPGANASNLSGINNAGAMVGTYKISTSTGTFSHGFRADQSGNFTTVDYPSATNNELF